MAESNIPPSCDEEETKKIAVDMTAEDKLSICQRMDEELEEFINSLERKRYTDGWPEDRWEEEMAKHPFFMQSNPENGELSPLAEGLANLKYDPEENTSLELANCYKEDGNYNFIHKNYRLAVLAYTEGIRIKADDPTVNASLYNNRAAAQRFLKNYRSALLDSEKALSFNKDHTKSRLRAANCAFEIAKYDICIKHCEIFLQTDPENKEVMELQNKAKKKLLTQDRDDRKKEKMEEKKKKETDELIQVIKDRGLHIDFCDDINNLDMTMLTPCVPGENAIVHIEDGILKWPVLVVYPEHQVTDFIRVCPENVPLNNQLEQLFPIPWDTENKYSMETINVYYEGHNRKPYIADPTKNLGDLMMSENFTIKLGTPAFVIVPRGSDIEKIFIRRYRYTY